MQNSKNNGFTLVETLVYIALIGMTITGFIAFGLSISGLRNKVFVVQENRSNARQITDLISQKVRQAKGVKEPGEGTASSSLLLKMTDIGPDLSFYANDGTLYMDDGVGAPVPVSSRRIMVSNLIFNNLISYGKRDNIKFNITLGSSATSSQEYRYFEDYETAVGIRSGE